MKSLLTNSSKLKSLLLTLIIFAVLTPLMSAQKNRHYEFDSKAIANLNMGIQSDNEGLKKSSIYLAGSYSLSNCVEALVEQLSKEKNPDVKILIALSLYKIGDEQGIKAIENLAANDSSFKVKRMGQAILAQFNSDNIYTSFEQPIK